MNYTSHTVSSVPYEITINYYTLFNINSLDLSKTQYCGKNKVPMHESPLRHANQNKNGSSIDTPDTKWFSKRNKTNIVT